MGDFTIFGLPVALGTMIYQAFLFTVLFLLLRKFVMPKLIKVLDTRKESIENQLNLAQTYKNEGEMYAKQQEELLQQAKFEAREMIKRSQKEAQNIIKMAKEEANMIRTQAYNSTLNDRQRDAG
jgi:F-type H+-transporting ATPase subunit b